VANRLLVKTWRRLIPPTRVLGIRSMKSLHVIKCPSSRTISKANRHFETPNIAD